MNKIIDAIGEINNEYVHDAGKKLGYERKVKRFSPKRLLPVAACICILLGAGGTAYANNLLGLKDWVKGWATDVDGDGETETMIALSGFSESPEAKALYEWEAFLEEYDKDGAILQQIGNEDTGLDSRYAAYSVYTEEMAEKLDEIVKKYNLKLHEECTILSAEDISFIVGSRILTEDYEKYDGYIYPDGTFQFDAKDFDENIGEISLTVRRNVKGYFDEVFLNIVDPEVYNTWNYKTQDGSDVLLALGSQGALILNDSEESFVVVYVLHGINDGINGEYLQALAENVDFEGIGKVKDKELSVIQDTAADEQSMMDDEAEIDMGTETTEVETETGTETTEGETETENAGDAEYYEGITSIPRDVVELRAQNIRADILNGNWDGMVYEISFPIEIAGVEYKNQEEYLAADKTDWSTPAFIEDLKREDCVDMFHNYNGIMMGDEGSIWLSEVYDEEIDGRNLKIISINIH